MAMSILTLTHTVAASALDLKGSDLTVTELVQDGYTNSGDDTATLTLDIASDVNYLGVIAGNIAVVKRGRGRVTLGSRWTHTKPTTVEDGALVMPDVTYMSGSGVTNVLDGGEVAFTETFKWADSGRGLQVKRNSSGAINIADGKTVTLSFKNCLNYSRARLRLTGPGILYGTVRVSEENMKDGVIAVENGIFRSGSELFAQKHKNSYDTVLEIGERGVADVEAKGRYFTLPRYTVLEGGTISMLAAQSAYTNDPHRVCVSHESLIFGDMITVKPSPQPSRILNFGASLANSTGYTVFNVENGASLEIDSRISPGFQDGTSTFREGQGFSKIGGGTLLLRGPVDAQGAVYVGAGTLVLAQDAYLSCKAKIKTAPGAVVKLEDGTLLSSPLLFGIAADPLLSTAEVWMDASVLPYEDGQIVPAVPNFGTSGGAFMNFGMTGANASPVAPTFSKDGINGVPALDFNGSQALCLDSYSNHGETIETYCVYRVTDAGSPDYPLAPFSMCCTNVDCNENGVDVGKEGVQNGHVIVTTRVVGNGNARSWLYMMGNHGAKRYTVDLRDVAGVAETSPFILSHFRQRDSNNKVTGKIFYGPDAGDVKSASATGYDVKQDIDRISLAGRLNTDGSWCGSSMSMKGRIGEMIVFSRTLKDKEREYVETYLRRKWMGSTDALPELEGYAGRAVTNLSIEVASGSATFAPSASGEKNSGSLVKTGAGKLVFAADRPDVQSLRIDSGTTRFASACASSGAAIWVDAADQSSITLAGGRVVKVLNKGSSGGCFTPNPNACDGHLVPGPEYRTGSEGINNLGVLSFDFFSALSTCAYTNRNQGSRRMSIYAVLERTQWKNETGWGNSGAPFSMVEQASSKSDFDQGGSVYVYDTSEPRKRTTYVCKEGLSVLNGADTGEPYLMTFQVGDRYKMYADSSLSEDGVKMAGYAGRGYLRLFSESQTPPTVDFVQLGGRCNGNGVPFCPAGQARGLNRMWSGKIGEFIVFNRRLSQCDEAELMAYLEKKWFGAGNGPATPPSFLSGNTSASSLAEDTGLSIADGVTVAFDPGVSISVGALESDGAVVVEANRNPGVDFRPLVDYGSFGGDIKLWTLLSGCGNSVCVDRAGVVGLAPIGLSIVIR